MILYIGLDDFDSKYGGCTTHLAFKIIKELINKGFIIDDYPRLVRLNPDVPWKTRGNGAVAFKVKYHKSKDKNKIIHIVKGLTEDYHINYAKTDAGVIVCFGSIPEEFRKIYKRALSFLVPLSTVYEALNRHDNILYWYWGTGRGLIGAAAALGADLHNKDHTYEILVYRPLNIRHRKRKINAKELVYKDPANTFANIDYETKRILITPHGPDPVILGIRGESPIDVYKAKEMIKIYEIIDGWITYITNQGTFENLKKIRICEISPFTQVIIKGKVIGRPHIIPGGHILLKVTDGTGEIDVMIYEPSGKIRKMVQEVMNGDELIIGGGVKIKDRKITLNTQLIKPLKREYTLEKPPICPKCLKPMKSLGWNKGYECKRCKYHVGKVKSIIAYSRRFHPEILEPPLRSIRHLTRPIQRIGIRNTYNRKLHKNWIKC